MPITKHLSTNTPDTMKDEGTDSLDTFIKQAVGKEPLFSFSRTGDSPVQWIQLLHALDQQDLPGWPLLTPMKVQMQKCDKCAREFCSPINYRRHIRMHRRSLNFHKEPQKYRDLLGTFWDKLSYDEAKEIMSFKDVKLEEVPGASIVRNISANLRKPIFLSLPQVYVKAGSTLVDIIQGRPSRLPTSSQELFSILDDASERTFLCAGTAESLQKYVFDGEAGKIGLEMKNLIACTSFLVEQKLVKAWVADKDAEALRCQKLLVEEEEAAQKRQAEQLERKRQRKLRQKEQRAKDQSNAASDIFDDPPSAETTSPEASAEVNSFTPDENTLTPEPNQLSNNEETIDIEAQGCSSAHSDSTTGHNTEHQKVHENGSQHFVGRWQVPKSQNGGRNGFQTNQNFNELKREKAHKHREQRAALVNGSKVWTKKPNTVNCGGELVKSRVQNDAINQTDESNCQLMIGSISVRVNNSQSQLKLNSQAEVQENGHMELKRNSVQSEGTNDSRPRVEDGAKPEGMLFSVDAAKAFLAQRWKEATSGDHVKLVLAVAPEPPPGEPDARTNHEPFDPQERIILGSAENRLGSMGPLDSFTTADNIKPKFRTKPEKGTKAKYIPKQRAVN